MPDPITVWMVHLASPSGTDVEGTLRLDDDALVFEHGAKPAELRFPFTTIAKVRRVIGSPVIVIERIDDAQPKRTAFYFVQPPPLHPPTAEDLARSSERPLGPIAQKRALSKRRHTRSNMGYLTIRARHTKPLVQAWTSELRIRIRETRA